jgi:hypothetical protein
LIALAYQVSQIMRQLKQSFCIAKKTTGFWMTHYTMSMWDNDESIKNFARSGAHLSAMKISSRLSTEIRTLMIEAETFPDWREAKQLLKQKGKVLRY